MCIECLNLLTELPLKQGELDEFTLNAKQVALSGMTESQQEFEEIHQFSNAILQRLT